MPIPADSAWRGLRIVTGLPQISTWPSARIGAEQRQEQFALAMALQARPRPAPRLRADRSSRRAGGGRRSSPSTLSATRSVAVGVRSG